MLQPKSIKRAKQKGQENDHSTLKPQTDYTRMAVEDFRGQLGKNHEKPDSRPLRSPEWEASLAFKKLMKHSKAVPLAREIHMIDSIHLSRPAPPAHAAGIFFLHLQVIWQRR
jgi:hypothetical protein